LLDHIILSAFNSTQISASGPPFPIKRGRTRSSLQLKAFLYLQLELSSVSAVSFNLLFSFPVNVKDPCLNKNAFLKSI
jgi:hypothetical protein